MKIELWGLQPRFSILTNAARGIIARGPFFMWRETRGIE
jgi:hypothetical protein